MERPELRSVETGSVWSDVVGPVMGPATLAARWGVSVEDVDAMVVEGRLLALTTADEAVVVPLFQFDAELKPIGSLSEVLHLLTAGVAGRLRRGWSHPRCSLGSGASSSICVMVVTWRPRSLRRLRRGAVGRPSRPGVALLSTMASTERARQRQAGASPRLSPWRSPAAIVPSWIVGGARDALQVAKYDPLFEHLCKAADGPLEMSFEAVDALVGGLPKSAYTYPAWWANETVGNHVEARAWMNAGRLVERVDLNRQVVWFSAAGWHRGS